jgi:hypothetical protein
MTPSMRDTGGGQGATITATTAALVLQGGDLTCTLDRTSGRLVELVQAQAQDAFISASTGPGGLEVYDELDRKWYSDLQTASRIEDLCISGHEVYFVKQFEAAPFALRCRWRPSGDGIRLHVDVFLHDGAPMRSIRVSTVLPATAGLISWSPSYPPASDVRTQPVRYCYGMDESGKARTGIPMLALYHTGKGGLTQVFPFEVPKVQLNMGVEPHDPTRWYVPEKVPNLNAEAEVDTVTPPEQADMGDRLVIRFTEKLVGLRPGKTLPFAMWFFAHEPDWRPSLGKVVETYREYFEPHPGFAAFYGSSYGANPDCVKPEDLAEVQPFGITHDWFHGHFEFHGEFLTDEAVGKPGYTWVCEPYPTWFKDLTIERIREGIRRLKERNVGTFLYGFNMHCDPTIIEKRRLEADLCKNEDGSVARSYGWQPVMFFSPETAYGRQLLDQMDRMMKMYPQAVGIGLDNWNYGGIDFGHDDGLTMINNRPAANLNFTQQRMIPAIAAKLHAAGRFVMTNKGRTIECMRGVSTVATESPGAETYATFAFINLARCISPTEYKSKDDPAYAEYVLKYLLVWGGQMSSIEMRSDPKQALAYKPLFDLIRSRRWVFTADPLTLPAGCQGQIFRIDPTSPWNPGAMVVTVVRPEVKWRDNAFQKHLQVHVRLPHADRVEQAWWLGVEASAEQPVACEINRHKSEITVSLPPVGAAGVLKLQ